MDRMDSLFTREPIKLCASPRLIAAPPVAGCKQKGGHLPENSTEFQYTDKRPGVNRLCGPYFYSSTILALTERHEEITIRAITENNVSTTIY